MWSTLWKILNALIHMHCRWLEDGGKMTRGMLSSLCSSLARLPGKIIHCNESKCAEINFKEVEFIFLYLKDEINYMDLTLIYIQHDDILDRYRGDYGYGEDGCRDARPAVYLQRATC